MIDSQLFNCIRDCLTKEFIRKLQKTLNILSYLPAHEPYDKKIAWNINDTCEEKVEIQTSTEHSNTQQNSIINHGISKPEII